MACRGRLFLTVLKPIAAPVAGGKPDLKVRDIVGLCVDAADGRILWQHEIRGSLPSQAMSGFSDASTPTPATDGRHVVFLNASGRMVCLDWDGKPLWERSFKPIERLDKVQFPFNKQYEPILAGGLVLNMEPDDEGVRGPKGWNRLVGLDLDTGRQRWISEDGLTQYNTPQLTRAPDGTPAVLIGRGGHHQVPEAPAGLSLIRLADGARVWQWQATRGTALYHASSDGKVALWMTEKENLVQVLDLATGKPLREISLVQAVDWRRFDVVAGRWVVGRGCDLAQAAKVGVFPAWYTNILADGRLFFLCFEGGPFRKGTGPAHSLGRVDLATGKVSYLELPTDVVRRPEGDQLRWGTQRLSDTRDTRGLEVDDDKRSRRDGWHWNFNANPVVVNHRLHLSVMNGMAWCIATDRAELDEQALVAVNDLGPSGGAWSLSSPGFSAGRMYHRTLRELVCIGVQDAER